MRAWRVSQYCPRLREVHVQSKCLILSLPFSIPAAMPVLPFTLPNFTPFFAAKNAEASVGRSVGRSVDLRASGVVDGNYRLLLGEFLRAQMNWG